MNSFQTFIEFLQSVVHWVNMIYVICLIWLDTWGGEDFHRVLTVSYLAVIFTLTSLRLLSSRYHFSWLYQKWISYSVFSYMSIWLLFSFSFPFQERYEWKFIKLKRRWKDTDLFCNRIFLSQYLKSTIFFVFQFSLVCLSSLIFWMFPFFSDHWSLCVYEMKIVKGECLYFTWIQLKENIRKNHLLTMSRGKTTWVSLFT